MVARPFSSTSIRVSWEEVLLEQQNGNITHYEILYAPITMLETDLPQQELILFTTEGPVFTALLQNLDEYTEYSISVRARTVVGPGPSSPQVVNRTLEDGKSS